MIATETIAEFYNSELGKREKIENIIVNLNLSKNNTSEIAIIGFVSNKFGTGAASLVKNNDGSKNLLFYDSKSDKIVLSASVYCWVCQQIVSLVKNWPQGVSCFIMCGSLCLVFVEVPAAMAACNVLRYPKPKH